jgi:hypothetical protein
MLSAEVDPGGIRRWGLFWTTSGWALGTGHFGWVLFALCLRGSRLLDLFQFALAFE